MEAAEMREILRKEYGINDEDEFNAAVGRSAGINLGIFTAPLPVQRGGTRGRKLEA